MTEHHLVVSRTARYALLGTPGAAVREVWYVLHGYGQLARYFLRSFRHLEHARRLLVAPEALSRFYLDPVSQQADARRVGAAWMTREDRLHEIDDYLAYLDRLHAAMWEALDEPSGVRVHVLGFSQGAATACRWLALGQAWRTARPHGLTLWGGDVPDDLDLGAHRDAFAGVALSLVAGTHDVYATPDRVEALRARLQAHALPSRTLTFDGGHRLDDETLRQLADDQSARPG